MQHHRILSRDEWLPARRRRLSTEREFTRRRDQLHTERPRNELSPASDLTGWVRRLDEYEEDRKGRASAA